MEAGDPSLSLDLMVRMLLAMGTTREDVAIAPLPFIKKRAIAHLIAPTYTY